MSDQLTVNDLAHHIVGQIEQIFVGSEFTSGRGHREALKGFALHLISRARVISGFKRFQQFPQAEYTGIR